MCGNRHAWQTLLAGLALVGCTGAGCVVSFVPDNGSDGLPGNGAPEQVITVRVVNATGTTLDPEIYVAAEPVSEAELFAPENKFTRFGVGTLGLLGPGGSDAFELPCAEVRVLATAGGLFGDDLENPDGQGRPIILVQDQSVFCGSQVTFRYVAVAGGGFDTEFEVD